MNDSERENALRAFERNEAMHIELLRASLDSARDAMKAMFLLNGGASIALLGFLASTFAEDFTVDETNLYASIMRSLTYFASGAFLAVFTMALAYLINSLYSGSHAGMERKWSWPYLSETTDSSSRYWWAIRLNWFAVATGAASLGAFALGLWKLGQFVL